MDSPPARLNLRSGVKQLISDANRSMRHVRLLLQQLEALGRANDALKKRNVIQRQENEKLRAQLDLLMETKGHLLAIEEENRASAKKAKLEKNIKNKELSTAHSRKQRKTGKRAINGDHLKSERMEQVGDTISTEGELSEEEEEEQLQMWNVVTTRIAPEKIVPMAPAEIGHVPTPQFQIKYSIAKDGRPIMGGSPAKAARQEDISDDRYQRRHLPLYNAEKRRTDTPSSIQARSRNSVYTPTTSHFFDMLEQLPCHPSRLTIEVENELPVMAFGVPVLRMKRAEFRPPREWFAFLKSKPKIATTPSPKRRTKKYKRKDSL